MSFPYINAYQQFFDSSGSPLASGTIEFRDPTSNALINSYPTADDADAQTNANSNPLTLNASGAAASGLFLEDGVKYKVILKDSNGATVATHDDVRCPIALPYLQTTAESAAGVTPTSLQYSEGDVRRYGIEPGNDVTTALNTFISDRYGGYTVGDLDQSTHWIYFPPGVYTISGTVDFDVPPNTTIYAYGAVFQCSNNGIAFDLNSTWDPTNDAGTDNQTKRRVYWKGGTFTNTNGTKTASEAIRARAMRMFTLEDVYIEGFYAGLRLAGKDTYRVRDCYFYNNSRHVFMPEDATVSADTLIDVLLDGCHFSCNGDAAAVYLAAKVQNLTLRSCNFNGACTSGQVYIADSSLTLSECIRIDGCHFEQIDSVGAVVFSESNTNGFYSISIGGGTTFNSGTVGWKGVILDYCRGVHFGDVSFRDGSAGATEEAINVDSDSRDIVISEQAQFLSIAAGNECVLSAASDRQYVTVEPKFIRSATPDILTNYGGSTQSDASATTVDMSAEWADWGNYILPPKGYEVVVTARDSGSASAGTDACEVRLYKPSSNTASGVTVWLDGENNSSRRTVGGFVGANDSGDMSLDVDATGANTLTLWIAVTGVHQ